MIDEGRQRADRDHLEVGHERRLGGVAKFRSAMRGPVDILRWKSLGRGGFAPHPILALFSGDVILADETFPSLDEQYSRYTVAHELGHVWDLRAGERLSRGMGEELGTIFQECIDDVRYLGTVCYTSFNTDRGMEEPPGWRRGDQYARTGALEDWAESFASYVYPNYWSALGGISLGEVRTA